MWNVPVLKRVLQPRKIDNLSFFKEVKGFSFDSRRIKKGEAFIALKGKHRDGHHFISEAARRGAALVVAQREAPLASAIPLFVVKDTYAALKNLAAYLRKKKNPFVYAITGSVGKTTTKEMLKFLLKEDFNLLDNYKTENNLLGVSKAIFALKDEKVIVLELGTNSPGEIKTLAEITRPNVGVITGIKAVHLEGLKKIKGIYKEKVSLLKANPKMTAVLNKDDCYLKKINFCKRRYWFGRDERCDLYARLLKRERGSVVFLIQDKFRLTLPLQYEKFISNVLAAVISAHLLGLPLKELVKRMNSFQGYPAGRMEKISLKGLTIINDAYNANPYSFKESLKVLRNFPQRKIAVIGDMLELGKKSIYYHRILAKEIVRGNFDYCLMIGNFTFYLKKELARLGYCAALHFASHKMIARFINRKVHPRQRKAKQREKEYLVFLKGSRRMELEKVIRQILTMEAVR